MVITDAALVGRIRSGETEAFGQLFERYHARCVRLACRLLGDAEEADDAVQDAFIRAYQGIDSYEDRDRFASWLMCIVVNRCQSAREAARRRASVTANWWRDVSERSFELAQRDHALAGKLASAIDSLPPDTRAAVIDKYARELTYGEMSAATGADVSALKMRVARGSAQLRRTLAGAGVTLTVATLIALGAAPKRIEHRPAAAVACDTLRTLMRDTLNPAVADSMLSSDRCGARAPTAADKPDRHRLER